MAKQRNSLGVCVIVAPVTDGPTMSWADYKKKYGVDLSEIFYYKENNTAGFRLDFTKALLVDWGDIAKLLSYTTVAEPIIDAVNAHSVGLSGDNNEIVTISSTDFHMSIDAKNKTIIVEEN